MGSCHSVASADHPRARQAKQQSGCKSKASGTTTALLLDAVDDGRSESVGSVTSEPGAIGTRLSQLRVLALAKVHGIDGSVEDLPEDETREWLASEEVQRSNELVQKWAQEVADAATASPFSAGTVRSSASTSRASFDLSISLMSPTTCLSDGDQAACISGCDFPALALGQPAAFSLAENSADASLCIADIDDRDAPLCTLTSDALDAHERAIEDAAMRVTWRQTAERIARARFGAQCRLPAVPNATTTRHTAAQS